MSRFSIVSNLAIGPVLNLAYSADSGGESAAIKWDAPIDTTDLAGYQKFSEINKSTITRWYKYILFFVEI